MTLTGKVVTTSKAEITYNGWIGCGYIIIDPTTGDGAYLISGGMSGGMLMLASFFNFLMSILVTDAEASESQAVVPKSIFDNFIDNLPCLYALLDLFALILGIALLIDAIVVAILLLTTTPVGWFAALLLALEFAFVYVFIILVIETLDFYIEQFKLHIDQCLDLYNL